MLSCIEALAVLLIYFLGTPRPQLVHTAKRLRFSYTHSLEDVVLLSTARALWLSLAYGLGSARNFHRWECAIVQASAPAQRFAVSAALRILTATAVLLCPSTPSPIIPNFHAVLSGTSEV